MNERDQELLDKQLWGMSSAPPPRGGSLALAFVASFLGGLLIGGVLLPHKSNQVRDHGRHANRAFAPRQLAGHPPLAFAGGAIYIRSIFFALPPASAARVFSSKLSTDAMCPIGSFSSMSKG